MSKFKLPTQFKSNEMTPEQLRHLLLNSPAVQRVPNMIDFVNQMQLQSLKDVLHDLKRQLPFWNFTKNANAIKGFDAKTCAKHFYQQLSQSYIEVYGYYGGMWFTIMLAMAMQNEVTDYFINEIEIVPIKNK